MRAEQWLRAGGLVAMTFTGLVGCGGGGGDSLTGPDYVTWNGSTNGDVVVDANNEEFRIDADTRQVVDRSGAQAGGLTVDGEARVLDGGVPVGSVQSVTGSGGTPIAAFRCNDGSAMDIAFYVDNTYSYGCAGSGSGTSSGGAPVAGGGTNPSGGATGGSSGGSSGGSGTSGSQTRSFITWTGSSNGESVVDASGDFFKFNSATRCLYSENRDTEYDNFCLSGGATVVFEGTVYRVTRVRSTANTCITALTTADGDYADIVTGPDSIDRIQDSDLQPESC